MRFCSQCGATVEQRVPAGDNRPRFVCTFCETIHYQNPNIVAGCLPVYGDRILLCRRAIQPRVGLWTLPAGFMENNETVQEGAQRETWEEARASVNIGKLFAMFNLPHISQVYMIFMAELKDPTFGPGPESLEVRLFEESELPWGEFAFPVIEETMKLFCADRTGGQIKQHSGTIQRISHEHRRYQIEMLE